MYGQTMGGCPQGGLTLGSVLEVFLQAISGVMHLHSLGIIHRDIRAANVLLDSVHPVRVVVTDFGVSHLLSAFAEERASRMGSASNAATVLFGEATLGPLPVRGHSQGYGGVGYGWQGGGVYDIPRYSLHRLGRNG